MNPVKMDDESEDSLQQAPGNAQDRGTARHVCHCGRSFIRKEHLRRHQASHSTGARSYVCHICQRSFNRNDVLRRHISRHSSNAPPDVRRGRACDACFVNKTRCDGGDCCSLCTKRRTRCTFTRELPGPSMDISRDAEIPTSETGDALTSTPEFSLSNRTDHEWPAIKVSSETSGDTPIPQTDFDRIASDRQKRYMTLFRALSKTPSGGPEIEKIFQDIDQLAKSAETEKDIRSQETSIPVPIRDVTSIQQQWQSLDAVRTLSTAHSKLYFKHFHHRWPILHAPTFDEDSDPFVITASVSMIGAWLEGSKESKDLALTIHDRLMNHALQKLSSPVDRAMPWPVATFQAALLNIIFGLYSGKQELVSRVILLHGLTIAALREIDFFRTAQTVPVSDFRPYLFTIQEGRKRLAFMFFKIDNYLSILRMQPPLMYCHELDFKLSCTFALWNSHGIYTFYKREPEEPKDRGTLRTSAMISNPHPLIASCLLLEDIQLGFCGMQHSIWTYSHFVSLELEVVAAAPNSLRSLTWQLNAWNAQLNKTVAKLLSQAEESEPDFPFKAYIGDESREAPNWRDAVLVRISSLILDTKMLYHLLSIHVQADVRTHIMVAATVTGPCPRNSPNFSSINDEETRVRHWAFGSNARRALLHATATLTTRLDYDSSLAQRELRDGVADPITHVSVATSALIVWSYASYAIGSCNCGLETSFMSPELELVGREEGPELDKWVSEGGSATVAGLSICKCNLAVLMEKFAAALPCGETLWEAGRAIAPMLWPSSTPLHD